MTATSTSTVSGAGAVVATLAVGQFVMVLDSFVMNVSMVTVAEDVGTDITGIQTAITLYALVMASFMITGGKIGQILGHKRAFMIGCVVYAAGSTTTALATSLPVLIFGWSFLEGAGAALILPAIVSLVASNFPPAERAKAYGLVSSAAAGAVALGPLIGGVFSTYLSWRWVFVGEVVIIAFVLLASRRMVGSAAEQGVRIDVPGTILSIVGLSSFVFGLLRAGTWGFLQPKDGGPAIVGLSPSFWLMLGGVVVMRAFLAWQHHVVERGGQPLVAPDLLALRVLRSGMGAFFFQFFLQVGLFFVVSLYLSVALGLSPIGTGVRVFPLSITLFLAAVGVPRLFPDTSPRALVRTGFGLLLLAVALLLVLLDVSDDTWVVSVPLLVAGLGAGILASQLAAAVVSSVPQARTGEVGGLQNTATNLGSSVATALAGAVIVSALTAALFTGLRDNPDVPDELIDRAELELSAGVPFVSDDDLRSGLADAGIDQGLATAILEENDAARRHALQATLALLVLVGVGSLFTTRGLPDRQPGRVSGSTSEPDGD